MPKPGTLPEHAQKIWDAAYAAAQKEYPKDTARQHATAWAAVEKAGYKKDKKGEWTAPAKEAEGLTVIPVTEGLSIAYADGAEVVKLGGNDGLESVDCAVVEASETDAAERKTDPDKGNYHVVYVESGYNERKRRAYLKESIGNCDPAKYVGLQMHVDHAAPEGKPEPEVRSVRDLAAQTTAAWVGPGVRNAKETAMHGMIHVFPGDFAVKMTDPIFRQSVKLSHLADLSAIIGQEADGPSKGRKVQVVTSIDAVRGVDFVTKDGARGGCAESAQEENMDWTKITLEELRQNCPELVTGIESAAIEAHKISVKEAGEITDQAARVTALETENRQLKEANRATEIGRVAETAVAAADSGIPKPVHAEVVARVVEKAKTLAPEIVGPALQTEVGKFVTAESTFIAKAAGKPATTIKASDPPADVPTGKQKLVGVARNVS
jgi:cation transport regulator ChaB